MPELNREQIIAELQEIIDHFAGSLNRYWTLSNALALIKQLTEEKREIFEEIKAMPREKNFTVKSQDFEFGYRIAIQEILAYLKKKYIGE